MVCTIQTVMSAVFVPAHYATRPPNKAGLQRDVKQFTPTGDDRMLSNPAGESTAVLEEIIVS